MSEGTQEHRLKHYGEVLRRIDAAKALVEEAHPGQVKAIFAAAQDAIHDMIAEASFAAPLKEGANSLWGAFHELLTTVVEGKDTPAAVAAEAKARELGIVDPEEIRTIREAADNLCDIMVTVERDRSGES